MHNLFIRNSICIFCYNLRDPQTRERKINALLTLNNYKPLRRCIIVTRDEEENVLSDGLTIDVVPIWKWLL